MGSLAHVLAVVFLVTGVSGCVLLDLLLGGPGIDPDASFPPFPASSPEATFSAGSATIVRDGETSLLDELAGPATLSGELGTKVVWTDGDGLYLTYYGLSEGPGESAYLSFDRIVGGQHWTILDPSRCVTTTDRADTTGLAGTATCRGLRWSDYFAAFGGIGFPEPIRDEPAFDAEITFEAH